MHHGQRAGHRRLHGHHQFGPRDGGAGSNLTLTVGTTGTLVLNANNTYSGATTVNAGTLTVGAAIGNAGASITAGGANVVTVNAGTLAGFGTINGNVVLNNAGIINLGSTGNITGTLAVNTPTGGSWNGTGTVAGNVNVTAATLTIGAGAQLNSNGTVNLTGVSTLAGAGVINANVNDAGTGNFTYGGTIVGAHTLVVNNSSAGSFAQMDLSGANSYTGTTTVTGALGVAAGGTLGSGPVTVNANSSLFLNASTAPVTANITINGTGTTNFGPAATPAGALFAEAGAANAISGTVTLASSSTIGIFVGSTLALNGAIGTNVAGSTLTLASDFGTSGGVINVAGSIGGTGSSTALNVVVDSATINETAAAGNVYNGTTTIRSTNGAGTGILNANAANALPTANGRSGVTMDDSGAGGSVLNLIGGFSQSAAFLAGATTSKVNLNGNTLTLGFGTGMDTGGTAGANFQGVISGTAASGATAIIKDETSTQQFSGLNTYTGETKVNKGVLVISQSTSGTNSGLGFGDNTLGQGTIVASGATLRLTAGTTITNEFLQLNSGATLDLSSGTATYTGTIQIVGGPATIDDKGNTLTIGNVDKTGQNLTLTNSIPGGGGTINANGVISGNSGAAFNSDLIVDSTTVNLNTANTYVGNTFIRSTIGAGVLNANVASALPNSGAAPGALNTRTVLVMGDVAGVAGTTLNINANGNAVQALISPNTAAGKAAVVNIGGGLILTIGNDTAGSISTNPGSSTNGLSENF